MKKTERLESENRWLVDRLEKLQAENDRLREDNERLRAALEMVDKWDLQWADVLDANVARVKAAVRAALKEEM
jgi:predicted nuclease with TOPRIM domain